MWALLMLVAQATVCVAEVAFVVPPRWGAAGLPRDGISVDSPSSKLDESPKFGSTSGSIIVGVLLASALARTGRKSTVSRNVWEIKPRSWKYLSLPGLGRDILGKRFQVHKQLRMKVKDHYPAKNGRCSAGIRFFQENNIWHFMDNKYEYWRSEDKEPWQLYKGPESHADNPYFPATSAREAVRGWASPSLSTSIARGSASTFAMGYTPSFTACRHGRPAAATVMKAHKKAAASSKNAGRNQNKKLRGLFYKNGKGLDANTTITRSHGVHWHAGSGVKVGRQYRLYALKEGILQWKGPWNHREATVVPMDYVKDRCVFDPDKKTLYPKVYMPWMGNAYRKARYVKFGYTGKKRRGPPSYLKKPSPRYQDEKWVKLYEDFVESPAGIAFKLKKDEKKKKNKEHAKWAKQKAFWHLVRKGKAEMKPRRQTAQTVAGGDSESEAEA